MLVFNATRDRGQAIHLLSEEAKQLLRVAEGIRASEFTNILKVTLINLNIKQHSYFPS
jgi:hypothetical protein